MNKLESLIALQDATIEQLGTELFQQQQDYSRLLRRMEALEQKMSELLQADEIADNERPPHY